MPKSNSVELLKALLRREVELFCRRLDPLWGAVSDIIETIRRNHWRAVFFGGTLRSLLISRLIHRRQGRPRDVDIVIHGAPLDILKNLFDSLISRETRFGGLQLQHADWRFDVWPLEQTWGIIEDRISHPDFAYLPRTTFLNIEAAAIDIWPQPGQEREIYSGDDQFFRGILDQVVEINRAENPFPDLCVVRSLAMTAELGFRIGKHLARYIAHHGPSMSIIDLETVQEKHYGCIRVRGATLQGWIRFVIESLERSEFQEVRLPLGCTEANKINDHEYNYYFLRTVERWQQRKLHPA